MNNFKLKLITPREEDYINIGADKCYIEGAKKQHTFKTIKISALSCAQANILKQTAISCGTDCLVHRDTITGKIEHTDCILSGSVREFEKIAEKLEKQPLKLKVLAHEITKLIQTCPESLKIRNAVFDWKRPYIMGILNVTPDSCSDGGCYDSVQKAFNRAEEMIRDGVDIIDIGGESTRPYADIVTPKEELLRVKPVLEAIRCAYQNISISIDTRNAQTAETSLEIGADMINDVSAGEWDKDMFRVCSKYQAPIILNHSQGTPENMQDNPHYTNCVDEIYEYLSGRASIAREAGINNVIIDPGIGFGKTTEQNLEIIKNIDQFLSLNLPVLVGHSRKNFLKETFRTTDIDELDKATCIFSEFLAQKGTNILRVHDVKGHKAMKFCGRF